MNFSTVTNRTDLCNITKTVTSSSYYWTVLILECIFCFSGLLFNGLILILLKRNTLLHFNIRVLFGHLTLTIVWFCIAQLIRILHIAVTTLVNPCLLVMEVFSCKLLDMINVLPLISTLYIMSAIGIERLYASYMYRTYESRKNTALTFVFIMTTWVLCLFQQLVAFYNIPHNKFTPMCMGIMEIKKESAQLLLAMGGSLETFASVVILVNYFINKNQSSDSFINRAQHSLTARFQVHQNVKINRMLLAVMLAHNIFWVLDTFYMIGALEMTDMTILARSCMFQVNQMLILIYCISNPIVSVWHNVLLQNEMKKYAPRLYSFWSKIYFCNEKMKVAVEPARIHSIERQMELMEKAWIESSRNQNRKKSTVFLRIL